MKSYTKYLRLFIFFSLSLDLILFSSPAFAQYFTINNSTPISWFKRFIHTRQRDDRCGVSSSRHGFIGSPYKYRDEFGRWSRPTRVLSVTGWIWEVLEISGTEGRPSFNIRIGDAKRYVKGNQTYVVAYKVENAILFFSDHDELYWNVTGNYWNAPIKEAMRRYL